MKFLFGRAIWALRNRYVFNKMCVVRVSKIINVHESHDKANSAPKGTHSMEIVQGRQ